MSQIFYLPKAVPVTSAGTPRDAARLYFFREGTLTPQDVFTTEDLDVAHSHPVEADANGVFPVIYLDTTADYDYRVQLKTSADVLIYDQDDIPRRGGDLSYDTSPAEVVAGVTPVNKTHEELHLYRYGTNTTPGTTDMTTACQTLATVVRTKSAQNYGGTLNVYLPADTISVWPAGTGSTLFDFSDCVGVTVHAGGCRIRAGDVDAAELKVFDLGGASNIRFYGIDYEQTYQDLDSDYGAVLFHLDDGAHDIYANGVRMKGGLRGMHGFGTIAGGGTAAYNITLLNAEFEAVYYPQQFRMSGNNYFARNIRTINCGRGYFPFNVRNHDVEMFSQHGGPFDDVLLKNYTYSAEFNELSNIRLVYSSDKRHADAEDQLSGQALIVCEFQLVDTTAGRMDDIDITLNVTATATHPAQRVFMHRKFIANGAADTTARGHRINNLKIRGVVKNWENGGEECIDLFSTNNYGWTGDYARNICLEDLRIEDSSTTENAIEINGQPFSETAGITLNRVQCDGDIVRTNWTADMPFDATQVEADNLSIGSGWRSYTPTWAASGTAVSLGDGVIAGKYRRSGDWVTAAITLTMGSTTTFGTGTYSFTLPTPSANESITYHGSGLAVDVGGNRYVLTIEATNNSATLRCWADGTTAVLGQLVPFTWAANDILQLQVEYQAAP